MKSSVAYLGKERRCHQVFITKHTEYHVRAGQVIAVRPRGADQWLAGHQAINMRLEGVVAPGARLSRAVVAPASCRCACSARTPPPERCTKRAGSASRGCSSMSSSSPAGTSTTS